MTMLNVEVSFFEAMRASLAAVMRSKIRRGQAAGAVLCSSTPLKTKSDDATHTRSAVGRTQAHREHQAG